MELVLFPTLNIIMSRIHLFEFEDLLWFPRFLRNYITDFLQYLANHTKMFKPVIPVILKGLEGADTMHMMDLGSGSGGGLLSLNQQIRKVLPKFSITLTDYYPNIAEFENTARQAPNISYVSEPVDAKQVKNTTRCLRTQFLSFHHFRPVAAKQILQNAVDAGDSIAIFEAQERSVKSIVAMLLSPVSVLFVTPFIRPFRWARLLFTYIIPVLPLCVLWDGIVSSLRTYSVPEMNGLINALSGAQNYKWETGRLASGPAHILYLLGVPHGDMFSELPVR